MARDHNVRSVGEAPRPYLHLPAEPERGIGLVVRTTMPAAAALPMLREAIRTLEPSVVFTEDTTAAQIAAATMAPTKVAAYASAAFGGLALLLAAVGLYGVDRLRRQPADARNRHPHGAGREARPGAAAW